MSWNGYGQTTIGALKKGDTGGITIYEQPGYGHDESVVAIKAVVEALPALVEILGSDEAQVQVSIGGHANPNHAPSMGWASDELYIRITRAVG